MVLILRQLRHLCGLRQSCLPQSVVPWVVCAVRHQGVLASCGLCWAEGASCCMAAGGCRTTRVGTERHLLCIEDPFELSHDLGRTVHAGEALGTRGLCMLVPCAWSGLFRVCSL